MEEKLKQQQLLEKSLDDILNPVDPKEKYVENLFNRLTLKPGVSVEYPNFMLFFSILSAGLFVGVLCIWLLTRLRCNHNDV